MTYSLVLTLEKEAPKEQKKALEEVADYVKEKKGRILNESSLGQKNLNQTRNNVNTASLFRIEIEFPKENIAKLKKTIKGKKSVLCFLLTKFDIEKDKKIKEKIKKVVARKQAKRKKPEKASKILDSIEEEKERIKDLDSELDKILNE